MNNILFRDDKSLLGSNWYTLSKKLFIIPFILSFIGILAIYSLIGTEYSIFLILKHIIFLFISFSVLILLSLLPKNDLRKFLKPARDAMEEVCIDRFERFGSAGQADKIKALSLKQMARRYELGELEPIVS